MPIKTQFSLSFFILICDSRGVCWGPYRTFSELVCQDPRRSDANPVFSTVQQPGIGEYLAPGSPLRFEAESRLPARPAPLLGADTDEILSSILGLSSARNR